MPPKLYLLISGTAASSAALTIPVIILHTVIAFLFLMRRFSRVSFTPISSSHHIIGSRSRRHEIPFQARYLATRRPPHAFMSCRYFDYIQRRRRHSPTELTAEILMAKNVGLGAFLSAYASCLDAARLAADAAELAAAAASLPASPAFAASAVNGRCEQEHSRRRRASQLQHLRRPPQS